MKVPAKKITVVALFFLLLQEALQTLPKPHDPDELGQVQILESALEIDPNYVLFLAEDFEGERPWNFYRGDSFLLETKFTGKIPKSVAFAKENLLFEKSNYPNLQNQTSFLIQSYVENPRLDHWEIRPIEPVLLPLGSPIKGIFWVYSEGHHINLSICLSQKKSKDLCFDLGTLNFVGWRRISFPIQLPKANTRLMESLVLPVSLKSIQLRSLVSQKKGEFHIYFDNLSFVIDNRTFIYPGAEVSDTWGNKR